MQVLPELKPILLTAQGAQLLEILRAMPQLQSAMRVDQIEDSLMPVFLRGLAQGDTRVQEEVLSAFKVPLQKVGSACLHAKVCSSKLLLPWLRAFWSNGLVVRGLYEPNLSLIHI